jgi:hypothetical protein
MPQGYYALRRTRCAANVFRRSPEFLQARGVESGPWNAADRGRYRPARHPIASRWCIRLPHIEGLIAGIYEIRVLDMDRRYMVIQPGGIDPATVPTIIDLHGSGLSPEEHVAVTDARSFAALGAVMVIPQAGIPFRLLAEWPAGWAWNVPGSPLPGESAARDEPNDMARTRSRKSQPAGSSPEPNP